MGSEDPSVPLGSEGPESVVRPSVRGRQSARAPDPRGTRSRRPRCGRPSEVDRCSSLGVARAPLGPLAQGGQHPKAQRDCIPVDRPPSDRRTRPSFANCLSVSLPRRPSRSAPRPRSSRPCRGILAPAARLGRHGSPQSATTRGGRSVAVLDLSHSPGMATLYRKRYDGSALTAWTA